MNIRSITKTLLVFAVLAVSSAAFAQIRISVAFGPPALPVYEQPVCPGDGYLWTPGYWAWDGDDYYWVPGTWVEAPEVGVLWTPPWWGWEGGAFLFHEGYWGPHVGFYGGISYGFGYFGDGFVGGRWDRGRFFYNRSVVNINVVNIHNVYNETIVNREVTRVSYNGGEGGLRARPTPQEEAAEHERHMGPVAAQREHFEAARGDRDLRASANHGKPPIAATDRPGALRGPEARPAREAGGAYNPPANREHAGGDNGGQPARVIHPKDLPPMERPGAPNTGNPKLDKKYQQQQDKLASQQDNERRKLQQQQEKEDQRLSQKRADDSHKQQTEQRHQQQTQQLQQRHQQQQQTMQQRHSPPPQHK